MGFPVPRWCLKNYVILWKEFKTNPFLFEEAIKYINEEEKLIRIVFHKLQKNGWMYSNRPDFLDQRKKSFWLISPNEIFEKLEFSK